MSWREHAACRDMPNEYFFDPYYQLEAIGACRQCPVRVECLADALDTPADQDHGIRGGLTRNQRNKLRGQR